METSIERLKCPSESFKGVKENINYELKLKNVISRFTDNKMLQKN